MTVIAMLVVGVIAKMGVAVKILQHIH